MNDRERQNRRQQLEQRLQAGEELTPGEAAQLLGIGRTSIHRLLEAGAIAYTRTPGGHRRLDPGSLLRAYEERRKRWGGTTPDPKPE